MRPAAAPQRTIRNQPCIRLTWSPSTFSPGWPSSPDRLARRTLLSGEEIAKRLSEIPNWKRRGKSLVREWTFDDFAPALAFINRVGELAEAANHHPDIYNSWNRVRMTLTTHDRGGLTDLDFDLAKRIDALD